MRTSPKRWICGICVLLACSADSERAASDDICADCGVRYEHVTSIGNAADPWSVQHRIAARILKRSAGDFFVFDLGRPILAHYSAKGEYLGAVGRAGSGPGEFRRIWAAAVDSNDSLFVYDAQLRTIAAFSPSLQHVRTVRFPHVVVWFAPAGDYFVVHGHEPDTVRGKHRLHLTSKAGEYVAALDLASEYHGRSIGNSAATRIGYLREAELYVAVQQPPTITRYDTESRQAVSILDVRPPWYPGPEVPTRRYVPEDPFHVPQDIAQRPARALMAIVTDEHERLWTLAWVEAPGWDRVDPPFGAVPPRGAAQRHMERYWVAQVDVYSQGAQQPMASQTLPFFGLTLLPGPMLVGLRENEDGVITLDIFRLDLATPEDPER